MRKSWFATAATAVFTVGLLASCAPDDGGPLRPDPTATPRPVVDVCRNIEGPQSSVPSGLIRVGEDCLQPTPTTIPVVPTTAPNPTAAPQPTTPPVQPTPQPVVPTPKPADTPRAAAPTPGNVPVAPAAGCPSLDEARKSIGVDVTKIGTESCAFAYNRGDFKYLDTVNTPADTFVNIATIDPSLGEVVLSFEGSGGTCGNVKAGTWRFRSFYPGLTLPRATELLKQYAPGAGYSPDIIHQQGCPSQTTTPGGMSPPATPAPKTNPLDPCPKINGIQTTIIPGGCLWKSGTVANLEVPEGARAEYGIPLVKVNGKTTVRGITQASLYNNE